MTAIRLRIIGLVQGVGFRDWLMREAIAKGLTGWVRNRRDGSVEALLIGAPAGLEEIKAAAQRGPRAARVIRVDAEAANAADLAGQSDFRTLPTV
jgi:acylphosphatase